MITAAAAAIANLVSWPAGRPLVRCFQAGRGSLSFNQSRGSARFRPIYEPDGTVVPTAYAAEDWLIAFAETVLRDDVATGGVRVLPTARLHGLAVAELVCAEDLVLVQLNGYGLRKLGLRRDDCIDTGPRAHPDTATLAQRLYVEQPAAQGILWTSHQADHGDAVVLWQTRIGSGVLREHEPPLALDSRPGLELVRDACEQAGVLLEM